MYSIYNRIFQVCFDWCFISQLYKDWHRKLLLKKINLAQRGFKLDRDGDKEDFIRNIAL